MTEFFEKSQKALLQPQNIVNWKLYQTIFSWKSEDSDDI